MDQGTRAGSEHHNPVRTIFAIVAIGGGAVANAHYQAALLAASTGWLERLGRNPLGAMIAEDLRTHHIGISHNVWTADALSPLYLAVYSGDQHRRVGGFLLPNCLPDLTGDDVQRWVRGGGPNDCAERRSPNR